MKKIKFLNKPITTPFAVFLYSAMAFLIIIVFLANFFMNSFVTLLNYAWGGIKLSEATRKAGQDLSADIVREGAVLLKNELIDATNAQGDKILPLKPKAKVTLLGKTAIDFIYGGTGSGALDTRKVIDLKTALENKGIQVNPTVYDAYAKVVKKYPSSVPPIIGPGYFAVNEVPYSEIAHAVTNSKVEYNDCAIVVLGRSGGEGSDLPNSYLYLTDVEKELLKQACAEFENIVVLINSNNTLQLRWLEDGKGKLVHENIDTVKLTNTVTGFDQPAQEILTANEVKKIKGALWIGGTGIYGLDGLASVLVGEVSPTGRLVDTWAYDVMSAPANNYIGTASYIKNPDVMDMSNYYNLNHEGIYIGYKYYESRYYDLKKSNANQANAVTSIQGLSNNQTAWAYDDKELGVQYPFGYGLSYTDFIYYVDGTPTYDKQTQTIQQVVNVLNLGSDPAKTTVQLYVQVPQTGLTPGQEKSAIQLAGFTKTPVIKPNKPTKITINVDVKDLRYYDKTGSGGFKVATGEYQFTTGSFGENNAHAAVDEILKTTGNKNVTKLTLQQTDVDSMQSRIAVGADGKTVQNRFTGNSNYADVSTYFSGYSYATRTNWTTFPIHILGNSTQSLIQLDGNGTTSGSGITANTSITQTSDQKEALNQARTPAHAREQLREQVAKIHPEWTTAPAEWGQNTKATVLSLLGTEGYINTNRKSKEEALTQLARQMKYFEATTLVRMGGYATEQVTSIGLPKTEDKDGPSGITDTFFNNAKNGTPFPAQIVIAATNNVEFAERIGKQVAREAKEFKLTGWYAPGLNLHRSALGGRNFEYYSEDSVLSAVLGTKTIYSAVEQGIIIFLKHIAMNDIETNRLGLGVWADEQTMRELYYAPFEDAIVDGKCNAVMTSFTRIGTRWTGHSYEFMTNILREEWGMNGMAISDYAGNLGFEAYLDIEAGLLAGNNLWLNTVNTLYKDIEKKEKQNDPLVSNALQNAAKNIIYTVGTSNAMHADMGLVNAKTGKVIDQMALWQILLLITTIILLVAVSSGIAYVTMRIIATKSKKHEQSM